MTDLGTALDSNFWDQPISSPTTLLDGSGSSVPGDLYPLQVSRASRALRIQQLGFLAKGFPMGLIPAYSSSTDVSFQSLLLRRRATPRGWLALVGEFRPRKLLSEISKGAASLLQFIPRDVKAVVRNLKKPLLDRSLTFRDVKGVAKSLLLFGKVNVTKPLVDRSQYSVGLASQMTLPTSTDVLFSSERHGDHRSPRHKLALFRQLPQHDITLEAAWPGLFIDSKGGYWEVPESVSLDLSTIRSESGFQYRLGIHKNGGRPNSVNAVDSEPPAALLLGVCGKAAFTISKSKDFWRRKETVEDILVENNRGLFLRTSYDSRLKEPHSAISGVVGGSCAAWFGGKETPVASGNDQQNAVGSPAKRSRLSADLFGSICYTYQYGRFWELYGDLTRIDARLDICSASALGRRVFNSLRRSAQTIADDPLCSPKLNLILQQHVAGPILFRADSRLSFESSWEKLGRPHMEDIVYSLSYSLKLLHSGKVVAWYSPIRREGMVELRLFEF